jgi:hypothetical protein
MRRASAVILLLTGVLFPASLGTAERQDEPVVLCWNKDYPPPVGNSGPVIRSEPRTCSLFKRGESANAYAVHARSLNWKNWGASRTTGKGFVIVPMQGDKSPLKLTLSKPITDCGQTAYSKASFYYPEFNGGADFRIWTCD